MVIDELILGKPSGVKGTPTFFGKQQNLDSPDQSDCSMGIEEAIPGGEAEAGGRHHPFH